MKNYLEIAMQGAVAAGNEILEVYESDFAVEHKDDKSPLTLADKRGHLKIMSYLENTPYPVLSEEGKHMSYDERKEWNRFWLVDPLDGTKEFIKRNGEFTVNIALIKNNKPHLGIVYCPTQKTLYYNDHEKNVYKKVGEDITTLNKRNSVNESTEGLRVVVSRSHMSEETSEYVSKLIKPKLISCGSSLKFLYIADNKADIYPRFGPTMEWDTGAAHSILNALDIQVINLETGRELSYNKENLLNPHFIIKA